VLEQTAKFTTFFPSRSDGKRTITAVDQFRAQSMQSTFRFLCEQVDYILLRILITGWNLQT
jgi:hypothetical protein